MFFTIFYIVLCIFVSYSAGILVCCYLHAKNVEKHEIKLKKGIKIDLRC